MSMGTRYISIQTDDVDKHQLVSQRAIVRKLYELIIQDNVLIQKLKVIAAIDIQESGWKAHRTVIHCSDKSEALAAFELMSAYDITSLPIMDFNDNIRGVSASDVFYARTDRNRIHMKVMDFVTESRAHLKSSSTSSIVSCKPKDDILTVLRILMHEEVHHVYILENEIIYGVISFKDLLRIIHLNK